MSRPRQSKITKGLIFGFCTLISIFLLFGVYTLYEIHRISQLSRIIYNHPLVVSNAALQANASILKMHRSMKDVVLFHSLSRIQQSIEIVNNEEERVHRQLDIVKNNILGDEGKTLENEARKLFDAWRPIRNEVIGLVHNDQRENAANITIGKGADHVALLEEKMLGLMNYARNKASEFARETVKVHSRLNVISIFFLIVGILTSLLVAFWTLKRTKLTEKNLLESEAKYRRVSDNSPAVLYQFIMSPNGTFSFLYVSDLVMDTMGISPEDVMKDSSKLLGMVYPEDQEIFREAITKSAETMETFPISFRCVKDGEVIWVEARGVPTSLPDGGILWDGFLLDITERKQVERALEASNSLMKIGESIAQLGFFERNWQTGEGQWSEGFYRLLGLTNQEAHTHEEFTKFIHQDDRQRVIEHIQETLRTKTSMDIEFQLVQTNGNIVSIHGMGINSYDKKGKPLLTRGTFLDISERKRTEKSLKISEENYRILFDNAPDLIIVINTEGNYLDVNKKFEEESGYSREEIIGESVFTSGILTESSVNMSMSYFEDILAGEKRALLEVEGVTKDGSKIPFELLAVPIKKNGKIAAVQATLRNIADRKQAEEKIRSAKSFVDRVIDMSPFAMWISDRKGTVIRTNGSLRETLNMPDDKIVGQYNVLKDENMEIQGVMPMVMAVFENHEPANFSIPWKAAKAGDVNFEGARNLYIDVSIFPILSAEGELTNAVCQWVDITEQKKAEESLRESHEKFKSIVDNIGIGVALISPAMEILEMNHQMREWFSEHDLDKRPICYRTFNNPPREEICEYCPTCKTLEDGKVHEDTTVTPQGDKTRNYRVVSSPLTNSKGEVTAAIEMVEDITDRLNLQAQLMQAQKMESVGLLAGGIAHDYNNISSIITGYSELALEKVDQDDPLHDDLMEIITAARRSTDITRQLLAFARQQTIAPKVLDLNDNIESMLKMLRRLIGEDIDLAWLPGAEVWPVKIDPSQVDQILANLCVNARDAIADVGKVTIETRNISFDEDYCTDHAGFVPGEYVLLSVSDDGKGMAPETLDKIFEPFFTTKGLDQGTGLGLSTVYGIVKQNNGFINVYSEPKNGTTIKIYLSRHTGQAVETHSEKTLEIPLSKGETLLLVEDDGSILKLGKRILENLGYDVLSANSPSEAIKLAEEHAGEINLLITDVVMPEMNGRELSEQLKRLNPKLKILFMSGYTANVIAHRGVLEDGVCFIPKPFSKNDLALKVREALDNDTG